MIADRLTPHPGLPPSRGKELSPAATLCDSGTCVDADAHGGRGRKMHWEWSKFEGASAQRMRRSERRHHALAQKGRFCARRGFVVESGVSPACIRVFGSFRMVGATGAVFGEPGECGDSSAGPGWGTGEDTSPAVSSSSVEKLRKSAMSGR